MEVRIISVFIGYRGHHITGVIAARAADLKLQL
jgi:hypothetical protein